MNEIIEYQPELNYEEEAFTLQYLQSFNAAKAIRDSGLATPDASQAAIVSMGHRMLMRPAVMAAIAFYFKMQTMSAAEALARLTEQARGEYAQYINAYGSVDLQKMKDDGKLHLIKSIKETKHGLDITFVDSQIALAMIAKHHGLLESKADRNPNDEESKPPTYIIVSQPEPSQSQPPDAGAPSTPRAQPEPAA